MVTAVVLDGTVIGFCASSALLLLPQHLTVPPEISAQVWNLPAASAVTPMSTPGTPVGAWRSLFVLSPSCPLVLIPQHWTPPLTIAQLCAKPVPIAVAPLAI